MLNRVVFKNTISINEVVTIRDNIYGTGIGLIGGKIPFNPELDFLGSLNGTERNNGGSNGSIVINSNDYLYKYVGYILRLEHRDMHTTLIFNEDFFSDGISDYGIVIRCPDTQGGVSGDSNVILFFDSSISGGIGLRIRAVSSANTTATILSLYGVLG
jgi:hypothetical protein